MTLYHSWCSLKMNSNGIVVFEDKAEVKNVSSSSNAIKIAATFMISCYQTERFILLGGSQQQNKTQFIGLCGVSTKYVHTLFLLKDKVEEDVMPQLTRESSTEVIARHTEFLDSIDLTVTESELI